MHCPINLLFFDIPSLYCYTNLNSSIICCLFSGDMYLVFVASISLLVSDIFETLVILSAILLPIKSPVASAVFSIALFEAVFIASAVDFLALSRRYHYPCFLRNTKSISFYIYSICSFNLISHFYNRCFI